MLANKRVHLIIHGIVQGVNFRYSTQQKAIELDIKGWVRNRKDGNVEVIAEGKSDIIDEFIIWCKSGPKRASVTKVEIEEVHISTNLTGFDILY